MTASNQWTMLMGSVNAIVRKLVPLIGIEAELDGLDAPTGLTLLASNYIADVEAAGDDKWQTARAVFTDLQVQLDTCKVILDRHADTANAA